MTSTRHTVQLVSLHNNQPFDLDIHLTDQQNFAPAILFIHGFKGFKDWGHFNLISDFFTDCGFNFFKLNLSHNGTTPDFPIDFVDLEAFGQNNFCIELDDLEVALDYLSSSVLPIDKENMFLLGHSRGGSLAIMKAAEDNRIKAVTTWAAVCDVENYFSGHELDQWKTDGVRYIYNSRTGQNMPLYYQFVENFKSNQKRLNVPDLARRLPTPVLIIHGDDDQSVSIEHGIELNNLCLNSSLKVINGAGHTFGGTHPFNERKMPPHSEEACIETVNFFRGIITS